MSMDSFLFNLNMTETSLQNVMKEIGEAVKLDDESHDKGAYIKYTSCIFKIASNLLLGIKGSQCDLQVTPNISRQVKLLQHCVERIDSLVEKMEKDENERQNQSVYNSNFRTQQGSNSANNTDSTVQPHTAPFTPTQSPVHQFSPRSLGIGQDNDESMTTPQPIHVNVPALPPENNPHTFNKAREVSPLERAHAQNRSLIIAYKARMERLNKSNFSAYSYSLTLQRKMTENLEIAKAQEEELAKKMKARQERLEQAAARRFAHPTGMSDEERELKQIYTNILTYENDVAWLFEWRHKLAAGREDPIVICQLVQEILRCSDHPFTEMLRAFQFKVYQQLYPLVVNRHPEVDLIKVDLPQHMWPSAEEVADVLSAYARKPAPAPEVRRRRRIHSRGRNSESNTDSNADTNLRKDFENFDGEELRDTQKNIKDPMENIASTHDSSRTTDEIGDEVSCERSEDLKEDKSQHSISKDESEKDHLTVDDVTEDVEVVSDANVKVESKDVPCLSTRDEETYGEDVPGLSTRHEETYGEDVPGLSGEETYGEDVTGLSTGHEETYGEDVTGLSTRHEETYGEDVPGLSTRDEETYVQDVPGLSTRHEETYGQDVPGLSTRHEETYGQDVPGLSTRHEETYGEGGSDLKSDFISTVSDTQEQLRRAYTKGKQLESALTVQRQQARMLMLQITQGKNFDEEDFDDLFDDDEMEDDDDKEEDDNEKSSEHNHGDTHNEPGKITTDEAPKLEENITDGNRIHRSNSSCQILRFSFDSQPEEMYTSLPPLANLPDYRKQSPDKGNEELLMSKIKLEAYERHLKTICKEIHCELDKLLCVMIVAYEVLDSPVGKDQCAVALEEPFFKPIWKTLLRLFRVVNHRKEIILACIMTTHKDASPEAMKIRPKFQLLSPSSQEKPYQEAIEELLRLPHYYTVPCKMDCLVKVCRLICESVDKFYTTQQSNADESQNEKKKDPPALGADDLVPVLTYVIVHSQCPQLISECQAIAEFINEGYMMGEEGYCLTTFKTAMEYLISLYTPIATNNTGV